MRVFGIAAFVMLSSCGGADSQVAASAALDDGIHDYRVEIVTGAQANSLRCVIWEDYHLGVYVDRTFNLTAFPANTVTEVASFSSPNFFMLCDSVSVNAGPFPVIRVYEDGQLWGRVDTLNFAASITLRDGVLCDANGTPEGVCNSYSDGG